MLDFEYLAFDWPVETDWVFAYSRHGVAGLLAREGARAWMAAGGGRRVAAIGAKTAEAWVRAGVPVDFVGTGEPASTAETFAAVARAASVTFLQAEQSRASVETLLGRLVRPQTLLTYRATAANIKLPSVDVALLTSPRSAELFFAQLVAPPPGTIFCIGPTTATAVERLGFIVDGVAAHPDIDVLLELALTRA